jgi:hypothetical protein
MNIEFNSKSMVNEKGKLREMKKNLVLGECMSYWTRSDLAIDIGIAKLPSFALYLI